MIAGDPESKAHCRDPEAATAARCRRVRSRASGFTLVEVMVAAWISAMMVTSFISIAMTTRVQTGRADHRLIVDQETRLVMENLRNYVSDVNTWKSLPNSGVYPGDNCTGCSTCSGGGTTCWALSATGLTGYHDLSTILKTAGDFTNVDPATVWLRYQVVDAGGAANDLVLGTSWSCPSALGAYGYKCVRIYANWLEQGI